MQALIHKPWMMKVKLKPQCHTSLWSAADDSVVKWRSKIVKRAMSTNGKVADWVEKSSLNREIKRLVR